MSHHERVEISGPAIRRRGLIAELRQRLPEAGVEEDRFVNLPADRLAELRRLADSYRCEVHAVVRPAGG